MMFSHYFLLSDGSEVQRRLGLELYPPGLRLSQHAQVQSGRAGRASNLIYYHLRGDNHQAKNNKKNLDSYCILASL
jgi:hypothetical protein